MARSANTPQPYDRAAYLKTVAAAERPLAQRLCEALERAYGVRDIVLYAGFPVVIRDGEWFGGFAMRSKGPIAYICGPAGQAAKDLDPLRTGKACIGVRATKTLPLETVLARIEAVWKASSAGKGSISKAAAAARDRARAKAASPAAKGSAPAARKAATKKPATAKTPAAKKKPTAKAPRTRARA
jgi:hypothetical protein